METRANYLLIGAFTLLGVLGALGFFLWLAKVEVDRQYAYYDVLFESVAGLGEAGDVRYNGLPVGQVVSLGLDPEDPSKVRVRIEVSAQTPIKTDTVAKLESQGVTGVSYVGLSGGGADTPLLRATSDDPIPRITAEKSAFQSLFDSAPALLEKAIALLEDVNEVVNEENKAAVGTILSNLSSASGELDTVLKDFSGLSGDLSIAAREIASFTGTLETVAATANVTMLTAGETLTTAKEAIERAHTTIDNATEALAGARDAFASANTLMNDKLPGVIDQVNATAATVETVVTDVGGKAGVAIDGASAAIAKFDAVGDVAVARLTEAEATLAALDKALTQADATMKAIEAASNNVDTLVEGDGKALVASARQAVDSAKTLMAGRIPALIDRADGALGAVEKTVTDVGARIDTLAEVATARLTEAEGTLNQADLTLVAVREASRSVAELAQGDGAALVKEAREAMTTVNTAIQGAAKVIEEDVPLIVADIRAATTRARELFTNFDGEVSGLSGRFEGLTTLAETALTAATDTFENANNTLDAVTGAIGQAEATLASAEKTFDGVNRVLDEDVDQILTDARSAMSALEKAVTSTAGDLPLITQDVRQMLASADEFVKNLDAILIQNSDQIDAFMRAGLPQFVRFTQEARKLVQNLERVTAKIERDPARFLLGTQSPEFRR